MTYDILESLFEAYEEKDQQRIKDILGKSAGSLEKAKNLANSMATKITDYEKAVRRGEAADDFYPEISYIFYDRAADLKGEKKDSVTKKDSDNVKPLVTTQQKMSTLNFNIGDIIPIYGKMIINDEVNFSNGARWLFSRLVSSGNKIVFDIPSRRTPDVHIDLSKNVIDYLNDSPVFYIKITKITSTWIEGNATGQAKTTNVLFPSIFKSSMTDVSLVRIKTSKAKALDNVYEIFKNDKTNIDTIMFKTKFLGGDEQFVFDRNGKHEEFEGGIYDIMSLNSKLTSEKGETVVVIKAKDDTYDYENILFANAKDMINLTDKPTKEQSETIAEWLSKEIGAKVSVGAAYRWGNTVDSSKTDQFFIPWFKVVSRQGEHLGTFEKSPFFLESDAKAEIEAQIELAKTKKLPYDVKTLNVIEGGKYDVSLRKLLDYAKLVGLDVKLKDFFKTKRGSIVSKSFGF